VQSPECREKFQPGHSIYWNLDLQFKEHKCKREDASQAATGLSNKLMNW
jgi:hypothetical protein